VARLGAWDRRPPHATRHIVHFCAGDHAGVAARLSVASTTRLRPARLAAYSAVSDARTRASASAPSSGNVATPIDTLSWPARGAASEKSWLLTGSRTRSATLAAVNFAVSTRITANSSPP